MCVFIFSLAYIGVMIMEPILMLAFFTMSIGYHFMDGGGPHDNIS